ncbi:hypothetical protein EGM70_19850 [Enterobacteriaceae bacterium 89]|nr:hypothetical protein [Enterobacteriaceae bacterium 89]
MRISTIVTLTGILLLAGCSSSSSTAVNQIQTMPIPVVQPQNTAAADSATLTSCYKENARRISELEFTLKSNMLQGVKPAEVLDTHSDAHRVFAALSKLEQISAMNESYHKEGNVAGLKAINQVLQPLKVAA